MLMRVVKVKIRPDAIAEFQKLYAEKILPELERVEGCLYAGLVQSITREHDGLSLTLWDTREHLDAYAASGKFEALIDLSRPFFADGEEWRLRIGREGQVEYVSVPQEPEIRSYSQGTAAEAPPPAGRQGTLMYLRMVTIPVRPGKAGEFRRIYERDVHPLLTATRGCRYVFMVESMERADEWVCLTVWDRKEDADRYEEEGGFAKTSEKFGPALTDLFQWKVAMDKKLGAQAVTSDDMAVSGYRVIIGKSFGREASPR
jgi:quinol monooxygenase YgiN